MTKKGFKASGRMSVERFEKQFVPKWYRLFGELH